MWHSRKEFACQYRRCNRCRFYPGSKWSPGVGNGNPEQCCYLENFMEEESGGLQSVGSRRVRHDWASDWAHMHTGKHTQTHRHTHTHTHTHTYIFFPRPLPGKNTEVGCHFLLQGIFPTQGLNLCLLHWQMGSLALYHLGSPIFMYKHTHTHTHTHTHLFLSSSRNWLFFFFLILLGGGRPQLYVVISVRLSLLRQCFVF